MGTFRMKGIHPSIASHRLNVFSTARPVRQRIRRFHPEIQRVIRNEIDKLLEAGFIREVSYPDWLANVVVVLKRRKMASLCRLYQSQQCVSKRQFFPCLEYIRLWIPPPGKEMLSFLDAFSGCHQIPCPG
ncbi:hypothetical protein CK203_017416 [Vitis vinifera]|uniref:Uncharacterized protein n=1 Tax=Vitis vinifera TaxID=29760 RepID=A0A438IXN9_VITVI|nr:hypothetical protein CK203_017416 [Vitis vinifera]